MNTLNGEATLLFAIGNDSRGDDGLGWAFAQLVEETNLFRGRLFYRYQLQVEDAELLTTCRQVIFVDACRYELKEGFALQPCLPAVESSFTTHALSPSAVLQCCYELYDHRPEAFQLLLSGSNWELKQGLSPSAVRHLRTAFRFFSEKVLLLQ